MNEKERALWDAVDAAFAEHGAPMTDSTAHLLLQLDNVEQCLRSESGTTRVQLTMTILDVLRVLVIEVESLKRGPSK